jgi:predicted CxxxxCH...CXXCH cytochrome family protein
LQVESCKNCHGDQLNGCDAAPSCDGCHDGGHPVGWRTDCTYCHGGLNDDSGAPPTDLDPTTLTDAISFTAHPIHQADDTHPSYGCEHCHADHTDVLSPGHMFDDSPTVAEVTLVAGLSPDAQYGGTGSASCTNLYCHGTGLEPGDYKVAAGETTCETCHGTVEKERLTFDHKRHIDSIRNFEPIACASCHNNMDVKGNLTDPSTHVDGTIDIVMDGVTYDPVTKGCSGTCHTAYPHDGETWEGEEPDIFGGLLGP